MILPAAVLLVWLALARGIAPLSELQARIRRREPDDLSPPIDEQAAPSEVASLVRSINELLARRVTCWPPKSTSWRMPHQFTRRRRAPGQAYAIDAVTPEPMELKRLSQ